MRTLQELAQEEKSRFPLGAGCLESNIYVDDIFAVVDALPLAVTTRRVLVDVL
jgi:hypothetical protein